MEQRSVDPHELMDVLTFCRRLGISRDTFYKWRQVPGAAPVVRKLPNGSLRILGEDFLTWLKSLQSEAA
ncbi:helix-turn-helix transcriptional regulator [Crossiella sp. CA198]|uniref:helix-turn-helix transcriptional regulator n=1 Tax=Crossiella sp. CA198 TaxID=3455607 RepID=UPI003F8D3CC5